MVIFSESSAAHKPLLQKENAVTWTALSTTGGIIGGGVATCTKPLLKVRNTGVLASCEPL